MTQNIYDNEQFFQQYGRLRRSREGLAGAPEWPALRAMLPDLRGQRVLDLGCGYGWFCRFAGESGAAEVLGLDVSERMLAQADASTRDPAISYARADLETVELPAGKYDLVYSSLTLHYLTNLNRLFEQIQQALLPAGRFVFSVEHPIYTAPNQPGWLTVGERQVWPLDAYLEEGPRSTNWLAQGVIKQHRTIGSYLNSLIQSGFTIERVEEWGPTAEQVAEQPEYALELQRPPFLLVAASRS